MSTIIVDVFEPDFMAELLTPLMKVVRDNLVTKGLCDYFWFAGDGHKITIERKTWSDLLNSQDRIERQLRTATLNSDEVGLLVEGVADPLFGGETGLFIRSKNGEWFRKSKVSTWRFDAIMALLYRLDKEGITVYHTSSIYGTAWALKAFVENSQKKEFTTMKRYVKTKPVLWSPDPIIESLMYIQDEKGHILGEKRAKELIKNFGSIWNAIHRDPEEVAMVCKGISVRTMERLRELLKKDGRG